MAENIQPIELPFRVDLAKLDKELDNVVNAVDRFGGTVDKAAKEVEQDFNKAVDKGAKNVEDFGNRTKQAGSKVAASAARMVAGFVSIAAAAAGIKTAIGAFADLESAMAKVAGLVDTSQVNIEGFTAEIRDLSVELGKQPTELAEALFQTISAGVDTTDAMRVTEQATRLAIAGFTDTTTAVDGLTSVMNAYGIATSDVERISDLFFKTQEKGKTTVGELAASIGSVSPIAVSAGLSIEDLLSSVAALTLGGLKTSQAVTGLRGAIIALSAPTEGAKKQFEEMGIEIIKTAEGGLDLVATAKNIVDATGGNTEAIRRLVPEIEGMNAVLQLGGSQFESFRKIQEANANALGATTVALEKQTSTLSFQFDQLKAIFTDVAIDIGQGIAPQIGQLVSKLGDLAKNKVFTESFLNLLKSVFTLIGTSLELVETLATFLADVAEAFFGVSAGSNEAAGGLEAFNDQARRAEQSGLVRILTAISDALTVMVDGLTFAIELIKTLFNDQAIFAFVLNFLIVVVGLVRDLTDSLGLGTAAIDRLGAALTRMFDKFSRAFKPLEDAAVVFLHGTEELEERTKRAGNAAEEAGLQTNVWATQLQSVNEQLDTNIKQLAEQFQLTDRINNAVAAGISLLAGQGETAAMFARAAVKDPIKFVPLPNKKTSSGGTGGTSPSSAAETAAKEAEALAKSFIKQGEALVGATDKFLTELGRFGDQAGKKVIEVTEKNLIASAENEVKRIEAQIEVLQNKAAREQQELTDQLAEIESARQKLADELEGDDGLRARATAAPDAKTKAALNDQIALVESNLAAIEQKQGEAQDSIAKLQVEKAEESNRQIVELEKAKSDKISEISFNTAKENSEAITKQRVAQLREELLEIEGIIGDAGPQLLSDPREEVDFLQNVLRVQATIIEERIAGLAKLREAAQSALGQAGSQGRADELGGQIESLNEQIREQTLKLNEFRANAEADINNRIIEIRRSALDEEFSEKEQRIEDELDLAEDRNAALLELEAQRLEAQADLLSEAIASGELTRRQEIEAGLEILSLLDQADASRAESSRIRAQQTRTELLKVTDVLLNVVDVSIAKIEDGAIRFQSFSQGVVQNLRQMFVNSFNAMGNTFIKTFVEKAIAGFLAMQATGVTVAATLQAAFTAAMSAVLPLLAVAAFSFGLQKLLGKKEKKFNTTIERDFEQSGGDAIFDIGDEVSSGPATIADFARQANSVVQLFNINVDIPQTFDVQGIEQLQTIPRDAILSAIPEFTSTIKAEILNDFALQDISTGVA